MATYIPRKGDVLKSRASTYFETIIVLDVYEDEVIWLGLLPKYNLMPSSVVKQLRAVFVENTVLYWELQGNID